MAKEKNLETKVNPFDNGVSYATFLEALGESDINEYLKDICTDEQIEFIKQEIKLL